jgi:hypothetical protein
VTRTVPPLITDLSSPRDSDDRQELQAEASAAATAAATVAVAAPSSHGRLRLLAGELH